MIPIKDKSQIYIPLTGRYDFKYPYQILII